MKRKEFVLLFLIIFLAFFLRFYKISSYPPGLYWDEISIGYNAYSVLKTGRDEHGQFFPLWFKAFGEYKLPLYIYLTIPSIALFGLSEFAVRFPSALFGTLTVLITYFLVKELFFAPSRRCFNTSEESFQATIRGGLPLLSSFLLAISPWHLHFSRAAFEANVALFLVLLGSYLFLKSLKKNYWLLFFSFLCFSFSFYTYNAERIFTPLVILSLLVIYRKKIRKFNLKKLTLIFTLNLLLVLPFLFFAFSPQGLVRARSESFVEDVKIPPDTKGFLKPYYYFEQVFRNYLSFFSFDFLFFKGDQNGRHSVREMGQLYLWQLPFSFLGLYLTLQKRKKSGFFFLLAFFFLGPVASSLARPCPHALRGLLMVFPWQVFSALGINFVLKNLEGLPLKVFAFLLFFFVGYQFFSYLHLYYIHYPKKTFIDWQAGYKQLVGKVSFYKKDFEKIVVTKNYGYPHLYFLFFTGYDPARFLQEEGDEDGFGKYLFVKSPYKKNLKGKVLYVAPCWETPSGNLLDKIEFLKTECLFKLWEI